MNDNQGNSSNTAAFHWPQIAGILLIFTGAMVLLDSTLKTGWLTLLILPAVGLGFLVGGVRMRRLALLIPGCLVTGLGIGTFLFFARFLQFDWQPRTGWLFLAFGLGWCLIPLLTWALFRRVAWWALITGSIITGLGLTFLSSPLRLTDFALYLGACLGLAFLVWGVSARLFGLIIPGCLLLSIGPGIYAAWTGVAEPNPLSRTGIMLVAFALGWGLITLFSRVITQGFVWWPLIPGGILAMVGWGLYIGGNPENALNFIGNTGSIGLIIFGVYLLLLRRGIQS